MSAAPAPPPAPRLLALCVDDFGASAAIDAGILQLAARARLSAVSCLAGAPSWHNDAAALSALAARPGGPRVGLHFNLTEGRPLSPALTRVWPRLPTLPRLIVQAQLRALPLAALRDELAAQWQAFEDAFGAPPAHVDGHQHVHHLPQLRTLVLQRVQAHTGVTVRDTGRVLGPGFALKRRLIEWTGGRALRRRLQPGRAANTALLGVYDFDARDYRRLMQQWLAALPDGAMIFCHPGRAWARGDAPDPIAAARVRELAYLDSSAFTYDLAGAGVRLDISARSSSVG